MKWLGRKVRGLCRDEAGAAAVEYAVIVGIVVVGMAAVLYALRAEIQRVIATVIKYLQTIQ